MTGALACRQTSRSRSRFGPVIVPSRRMSVTTYRAQPAFSSRASTSNRSPPSLVQPRAASVRPRTSSPMATRSPYSPTTRSHQSGSSSAAVPMLTRAAPVASAARSDSSSRIPPDSSTLTSSRPITSASSAALEPRPNAASRSTRWTHAAPSRCQASAASTGSPYRVSLPAAPWTSRTAWPSATSTAGSRVSIQVSDPGGQRRSRVSTTARARPARPVRSARSGWPDRSKLSQISPIRITAATAIAARWVRVRRGKQPAGTPVRQPWRQRDARSGGVRHDARSGAPGPPSPARAGLALPPAAGPVPCSQASRDPVAQQRGAGVAGLLRVELGGPQRAQLDGGDERVAVLGQRHQSLARTAGVAAYEWTK